MQPYNENENAVPVTVIISTRNRSEDLTKAVKTVLQLDYPNFQLIVVDQSDDDLSQKVMQPFLADPRLCYLPSKTRGVAAGRNVGVANTVTELIAITDDDCEVPSNWLTEMVAAFQVDERIGLVYGDVTAGPHDESAGFIPTYNCKQSFLARSIWHKNQVRGITACAGIRRSIWQAIGGFDSLTGPGAPFKACADGDYTIKVLLNGYYVYQTPNFTAVHNGFRTWQQGRSLASRNWFGIGASLTKYIKCGHWQLLSAMIYEVSLVIGRVLYNLVTKQRLTGVTPLLAFVQGVVAALKTPVDRETHNFRLPAVSEADLVKSELPVTTKAKHLADS